MMRFNDDDGEEGQFRTECRSNALTIKTGRTSPWTLLLVSLSSNYMWSTVFECAELSCTNEIKRKAVHQKSLSCA